MSFRSHRPLAFADERRWQRLKVFVVLSGARTHQQVGFIAPLIIQNINPRIDRHVTARLLEIAAHFVVQVRVRAPSCRADSGNNLSLPNFLPAPALDAVAVAVDRDEAGGAISEAELAQPPPVHALTQA